MQLRGPGNWSSHLRLIECSQLSGLLKRTGIPTSDYKMLFGHVCSQSRLPYLGGSITQFPKVLRCDSVGRDKAWEFLDLWTSESGHIRLPFGVTASKVWDAELWQGTGILICMQKNTRVQNCYSGATLFLRIRVPTGSYN